MFTPRTSRCRAMISSSLAVTVAGRGLLLLQHLRRLFGNRGEPRVSDEDARRVADLLDRMVVQQRGQRDEAQMS